MNFLDDNGWAYIWSKLKALFGNKVDKVTGKGLSTNDYTTPEQTKVGKIVINGSGEQFLGDDGNYHPVSGGTITDVMQNGVTAVIDGVAYITTSQYALAVDLDLATGKITVIESKIPAQASSSNQLADKNFVNSTVNGMASFKVFKDNQMSDFGTHAELAAAIASNTFFRADGIAYVPTSNDYAVIMEDETAPAPFTGETTRWKLFGSGVGWGFDYPLGRSFTQSELATLASGMTEELRIKLEGFPDTITAITNDQIDVIMAS